jgi:hypothetical protein
MSSEILGSHSTKNKRICPVFRWLLFCTTNLKNGDGNVQSSEVVAISSNSEYVGKLVHVSMGSLSKYLWLC